MTLQKNSQPLVSIMIPMYNAVDYIAETISSIQSQTYKNWELIVVDDISTDGSWELVNEIAKDDSRITVFRNGRHRGVAGAANLALSMANGDLIARIDADDIALPTRLQKQVDFLLKNEDVVAVGGQCLLIDKNGKVTGEKHFPTDSHEVYNMMFYSIATQQPSLMVHRGRLPKHFVWYEEGLNTAEEVELLFKFFKFGKVVNLPDYLIKYRIHGNNISLKDPKKTFYLTFTTRLDAIWKHDYRPTLWGICVTLAQFFVVTILPEKWIYPIYALLRGLKRRSLTLKTSNLGIRNIAKI